MCTYLLIVFIHSTVQKQFDSVPLEIVRSEFILTNCVLSRQVMEQMYMLEIFVDKVTIFPNESETSGEGKKLIIKIKFGPKTELLIKENQLIGDDKIPSDEVETRPNGLPAWTRTVRVGQSYLFPAYSDTVLMIMNKFPLEIEVWTDDPNEEEIYVGIGRMEWNTEFFHMLKESAERCKRIDPLTVKQVTDLRAECCCKICGQISFILRLSCLGVGITTEFQQLMADPDTFVFRTDKTPSAFQCKRIDGDPNFTVVGSIYETTTLECPQDPGDQKIDICTDVDACATHNKSKSCEGLPPHGLEITGAKTKYPITKIKMGDITGPCGNANCELAQRIKNYIRNLDTYKKATENKTLESRPVTGKVCGKCICKDDRWHRETCPTRDPHFERGVCKSCGGYVGRTGKTCDLTIEDITASKTHITHSKYKLSEHKHDDIHSKNSDTSSQNVSQKSSGQAKDNKKQGPPSAFFCTVHHGTSNNDVDNTVKRDCTTQMKSLDSLSDKSRYCCCNRAIIQKMKDNQRNEEQETKITHRSEPISLQHQIQPDLDSTIQQSQQLSDKHTKQRVLIQNQSQFSSSELVNRNQTQQYNPENSRKGHNSIVYMASEKVEKPEKPNKPEKSDKQIRAEITVKVNPVTCTTIVDDNACRCEPIKPKAPCNTYDCVCISQVTNKAKRKAHKPYCPSYVHRTNCPVTLQKEEEQENQEEKEKEKEVAEELPYGLPPIKLGPCPVMGRPCTVPDGFARMYRTAALEDLPKSYTDAGKICCSKEYERIKKAIKEYMLKEKNDDYRCAIKFAEVTETRCCDKGQILDSLVGKDCCGTHKLELQDKFKNDKPNN